MLCPHAVFQASHNPPNPAMLKLADRLGVMFLDENRVFAVGDQCTDLDARPLVVHTCTPGLLAHTPPPALVLACSGEE